LRLRQKGPPVRTAPRPTDYPNRIRGLRIRLGLTQARLAELLGISFASVNRWENGQSRPNSLAWEKLLRAEALGIAGLTGEYGPDRLTREPEAVYTPTATPGPVVDFSSDAEVVRVAGEGERLTYGHLFNPAFATETSLIHPLPHQHIAVYEQMLPQTRLRFLLADDAGAGKTIMTGLYIREMLSRRLVRRVLIVPPAGLVGNWERELRTLFGLRFRILTGTDARLANPFVGPDSDLVIISIDTLAGEASFSRLHEPAVEPYDLVVFDEAHKLSAHREPDMTVRKTDRYRLAEVLAGISDTSTGYSLDWGCHHLLLLTATPHMGKDFPYYCLWRLLAPEVLSTLDAFNSYPQDARRRHFIRRTKEELVRYDGTPIYPMRVSDTLSYGLTQGEISEQKLYDETTAYISNYYNRARILNRSAVRLAMSVFQRRLASSTYALMRSFERRLDKLNHLIDDVQSGRITVEQLAAAQRQLDRVRDVLEEKTADDEVTEEGLEENEAVEREALGGVVAHSLAELEVERRQVQDLVDLSRRVYEQGEESKLSKLLEVLRDPKYENEKLIIFSEHKDTLDFLVRRLEGIGFTGQVASIHGGMDFRERERQVEFFRRPVSEGGAKYLVGTDAAGEGINLQFCWLMVNYDIPWNPARLEQRMGRIHRYLQQHDPVVITNLVTGGTREGRVLKVLLIKLEDIRKELGSDKVFDVVGRLFEGLSIKDYMDQLAAGDNADEVSNRVEGKLTAGQVKALRDREKRLFGDGGDVARDLHRLNADREHEVYLRLLPGYVRGLLEKAAPLLGIGIEGNLDATFSFRALKPGALDSLWPILESYEPDRREYLTVHRPDDADKCVWLHPGEPVFDAFVGLVQSRFSGDALKGAVFVDPTAERPYMFHLALVSAKRQADPALRQLARSEVLERRLAGLRQEESGEVQECPVEHLLLLKGGQGVPLAVRDFAATVGQSCEKAKAYATENVARALAERHRSDLQTTLAEREDFLRRGFDYQAAELATARARLREKAEAGDPGARAELGRIKERQRNLADRREQALAVLRREPELIVVGEIEFLAHALVVPSADPEDRKRHDREVEAVAMRVACAYEESLGAVVKDVSTPELAVAAGLTECPGFDMLSQRPDGGKLGIEVKGRAQVGDVELSENEWARACNLRNGYWLYVVYQCATAQPRIFRVRNPFGALLARAKGGVVIDEQAIVRAAEA